MANDFRIQACAVDMENFVGFQLAAETREIPLDSVQCKVCGFHVIIMGKPSYPRKFNKKWLNDPDLKKWLIEKKNTDDIIVGYCKECNCHINTNRLPDLKAHSKSKKHLSNVKILVGVKQNQIQFKPKAKSSVVQETEMANVLLSIHAGLKRLGKSCYDYKFPEHVVAEIGKVNKYKVNKLFLPKTNVAVEPTPSTSSSNINDEPQEPTLSMSSSMEDSLEDYDMSDLLLIQS